MPTSERFFPSVSGNLEGKGKAERAGEAVADGKVELAKVLQEKIYSIYTSLSRKCCYFKAAGLKVVFAPQPVISSYFRAFRIKVCLKSSLPLLHIFLLSSLKGQFPFYEEPLFGLT